MIELKWVYEKFGIKNISFLQSSNEMESKEMKIGSASAPSYDEAMKCSSVPPNQMHPYPSQMMEQHPGHMMQQHPGHMMQPYPMPQYQPMMQQTQAPTPAPAPAPAPVVQQPIVQSKLFLKQTECNRVCFFFVF